MDHKSGYKKVKHLEKKHSPLLTKPHKDLRLTCAKDHITWNEAWHNVIWSDEKKFNLDSPDDFSYDWHGLRREEESFRLVLKVGARTIRRRGDSSHG